MKFLQLFKVNELESNFGFKLTEVVTLCELFGVESDSWTAPVVMHLHTTLLHVSNNCT